MLLKCKMCGGDLFIQQNSSIAICDYCGTKQTIPTTDNETKLSTYARANRLRQGFEFEKAASIYESIIRDYPNEAEGYWGLVLCKYGISYVDDPKTGEKIPVINRMSYDSLEDNEDWKKAYQYASEEARELYFKEANYIESIRRGAIEVSSKEEPYDIFICYKAGDASGNRTEESVIAQDYYDALTAKGYKVFFAEITLEEKIGQEYEPIIFAALNSAKVMLVFGTNYDNYNATWVKNEWMRFLHIMQTDKEKVLIPCYKNIDPYDLPMEFANLQAQNLGKIGAMQDILRGISKIIPLEQSQVITANSITAEGQLDALLTRLNLYLENEDYDNAKEIANQILNISPKNKEAYKALVLSEYNIKDIGKLVLLKEDFRKSKNYKLYYKINDEGKNDLVELENKWVEKNKARTKQRKKNIIICSSIGVVVTIIGLITTTLVVFNSGLKKAQALALDGKYNDAMNVVILKDIAKKKDPMLFKYIEAGMLLDQGDWKTAKELYKKMDSDYCNVKAEIDRCEFVREDKLFDDDLVNGNYMSAISIADKRHAKSVDGWEDYYERIIPVLIDQGNKVEEYAFVIEELYKFKKYGVDCENELKEEIGIFENALPQLYKRGRNVQITKGYSAIFINKLGVTDTMQRYNALAAIKTNSNVADTTGKEYINILKRDLSFEDSAQIVVKNQEFAEIFLQGTWKSGNYYFTMKSDGSTTYNIPWIQYGAHYQIVNGTYWLHKNNEYGATGKKCWDIKVISENSISVYAYANGQTYTMTRQ